jgi:hypothetical protein
MPSKGENIGELQVGRGFSREQLTDGVLGHRYLI